MNRLLLTLGALLVLFSACTKTDSPVSTEEDLRSGTWHRTSGKVTYKDTITRGDSTRVYDTLEAACRRDNSLVFKENFVGVVNLGAIRCSAGEADTKGFRWQVTQDGSRISIYDAIDYFPTDNVDAAILIRTLGFLTIQYRVIKTDPIFQTADTFIYTDVLRRN